MLYYHSMLVVLTRILSIWKELRNNGTATAGNTGEYVPGPCVQGVFTNCLA